ncbi:aminotransferase class V-fold PLP-dependent enzyme [Enterobacter hormaechei]
MKTARSSWKLDALLDDRTRLVAVTHLSNVLGTENPVALMSTKPIRPVRKC